MRTSACGIPTTPSSPQISSASSHIVTRCRQRCFPSSLFPSQPTDEPNDSGSNYAFAWDNLRTPLDQDLVYPCKTNMRVENTTEWKSEVCSKIVIRPILIFCPGKHGVSYKMRHRRRVPLPQPLASVQLQHQLRRSFADPGKRSETHSDSSAWE